MRCETKGFGNNVLAAIQYTNTSRPAVGVAQHLVKWVLLVKLPEHEADLSLPSSAKVKNMRSYTLVQGWANFFVGGPNEKSKMSGGPT
jgi:hypothetical protein